MGEESGRDMGMQVCRYAGVLWGKTRLKGLCSLGKSFRRVPYDRINPSRQPPGREAYGGELERRLDAASRV